jgi:hypothetical protein
MESRASSVDGPPEGLFAVVRVSILVFGKCRELLLPTYPVPSIVGCRAPTVRSLGAYLRLRYSAIDTLPAVVGTSSTKIRHDAPKRYM